MKLLHKIKSFFKKTKIEHCVTVKQNFEEMSNSERYNYFSKSNVPKLCNKSLTQDEINIVYNFFNLLSKHTLVNTSIKNDPDKREINVVFNYAYDKPKTELKYDEYFLNPIGNDFSPFDRIIGYGLSSNVDFDYSDLDDIKVLSSTKDMNIDIINMI